MFVKPLEKYFSESIFCMFFEKSTFVEVLREIYFFKSTSLDVIWKIFYLKIYFTRGPLKIFFKKCRFLKVLWKILLKPHICGGTLKNQVYGGPLKNPRLWLSFEKYSLIKLRFGGPLENILLKIHVLQKYILKYSFKKFRFLKVKIHVCWGSLENIFLNPIPWMSFEEYSF